MKTIKFQCYNCNHKNSYSHKDRKKKDDETIMLFEHTVPLNSLTKQNNYLDNIVLVKCTHCGTENMIKINE